MDVCEVSVKFNITKRLLELIKYDERYRIKLRWVKAASDSTEQQDIISLDFEIVGLCQYPAYAIKTVEPIDIYIAENTIPIVVLRTDFPTVPHLNIHSDNSIKSMCYSELPFSELRHKMNSRFLLECINNWFVKTARNELHKRDQPLEPFFPYVKDTIVLNSSCLSQPFSRFSKRKNMVSTVLVQDDSDMSGENFAVLTLKKRIESGNIIRQIPKTLNQLLNIFSEETAYIQFREWLHKLFLIKTNPKEYNLRFKQSDYQLQNCRCLLVLIIPLARQLDEEAEQYDSHVFMTNQKLSAILKDFGFTSNRSKLESNFRNNMGENISLTPYNLQLDISPSLARIYNGENGENGQFKFTIIGAGALGSQIVSNCIHSGFGEWIIIDNDILWAHNIARHALTREDIGRHKAEALVEKMKRVTLDAKISGIVEDIFTECDDTKNALAVSDIIVDTSASPAVERYLAIEQQSTARKVSFFLNPQGNSTVMLFEDASRDIRLDLLEMQYYYTLLSDEKYTMHLSVSDMLIYSGTCRSTTSRLPQDNVALSAALCCKALKEHSQKTEAAINIWTYSNGNVKFDKIAVYDWNENDVGSWKVYVFKPLIETIYSQRQSSIPNETGGVLVGAFDYARKFLYLVGQIESPDDSISSPTSYIRGCHGLEQRLNRIEDVVKDNLYYVGEWHSHPNTGTQMSRDDKILFSAIVEYNREKCIPGCMLIAGSSEYSIYIDE